LRQFSSALGAVVRGIDPETGHYFDDTKRYIESSNILTEPERIQIYEKNARHVFPRLDRVLSNKGL
jgi:4-oxalmesaconate hydratase